VLGRRQTEQGAHRPCASVQPERPGQNRGPGRDGGNAVGWGWTFGFRVLGP
jgi:hypothetical protein